MTCIQQFWLPGTPDPPFWLAASPPPDNAFQEGYANVVATDNNIYWDAGYTGYTTPSILTADNAKVTLPAGGNLTEMTTSQWFNQKTLWASTGRYIWWRNYSFGLKRWDTTSLLPSSMTYWGSSSGTDDFLDMIVDHLGRLWVLSSYTAGQMRRINMTAANQPVVETRNFGASLTALNVMSTEDTFLAVKTASSPYNSTLMFLPASGTVTSVQLEGGYTQTNRDSYNVFHNPVDNTVIVIGSHSNLKNMWVVDVTTKAQTYVDLSHLNIPSTPYNVFRYDSVANVLWLVWFSQTYIGSPTNSYFPVAGEFIGLNPNTGAAVFYKNLESMDGMDRPVSYGGTSYAPRACHTLGSNRVWYVPVNVKDTTYVSNYNRRPCLAAFKLPTSV